MEHKSTGSAGSPSSSSSHSGNAPPLPDQDSKMTADQAKPSTTLPTIVLPEEKNQVSTTAPPADPLMANPDYQALKQFLEESMPPTAEGKELSDDRLVS